MGTIERVCAAVALLLAFTPAFAAQADIHVMDAWARATPGGSNNAAVYFTIVNSGPRPDRLLRVVSPAATKAELHETMSGMGGMMEMKPSGPVALEPGATVIFKPLGRHLMLMGLKKPLKQGDALSVTLYFEKAGTISVSVEVVSVSARGP